MNKDWTGLRLLSLGSLRYGHDMDNVGLCICFVYVLVYVEEQDLMIALVAKKKTVLLSLFAAKNILTSLKSRLS